MNAWPIVPEDNRQSATAQRVARGARRVLRSHGFVSVTEMTLPSGQRADIVALAPNGDFIIVEIKSSVADFRSDLKWPDYRAHCDRLFFAIPEELPPEIMPTDAGLIIADAYGAAFVREAPSHRMAGATRRSMLLAFGRLAADRLHLLWDRDLED